MPPLFALITIILFSLYLLYLDIKNKPNVSGALWIPLIWFLIIMSRMVAQWFTSERGDISVSDYEEGNVIDRNIFLVLMIIGSFILLKRKISWSKAIRNNLWLVLLFIYFALSILWSDFMFVAFKRYIKAIGALTMALIIVTEKYPFEAIKTIIKRCAYILIPLSIVLIKYFPAYGVWYHRWSGEATLIGVCNNKNALGVLCLICGLVVLFDILANFRKKSEVNDKIFLLLQSIVFLMSIWLLIKCQSATALMCFIMGISIFFILGIPFIRRNVNKIGYYTFFLIIAFLMLQFGFNISETIITALGRDVTLTGRTEIWQDALSMGTNPFIGVGFESFWMADRISFFWDKYWFHPTEAHNGYLETYLSYGFIGLAIFAFVIIKGFKSITNKLMFDFDHARLMLTFFIIILFYNITESGFAPIHQMGFIFLLTILNFDSPNMPHDNHSEINKLYNSIDRENS